MLGVAQCAHQAMRLVRLSSRGQMSPSQHTAITPILATHHFVITLTGSLSVPFGFGAKSNSEMACKSNGKVMCGKNGGIHCVYSQDSQVWYSVLLARLGVMCKSHGRWLYILLAMLHVTPKSSRIWWCFVWATSQLASNKTVICHALS